VVVLELPLLALRQQFSVPDQRPFETSLQKNDHSGHPENHNQQLPEQRHQRVITQEPRIPFHEVDDQWSDEAGEDHQHVSKHTHVAFFRTDWN
jgi:hypothetical protein